MKSDAATMQVGKAGVTEAFLSELKARLEKHGIMKVRLLKSARAGKGRRELAGEIAGAMGAGLVDVRGNTFILEKT